MKFMKSIGLCMFLLISFSVFADIIIDNDQTEFDLGTYNNTKYNNAIVLSTGNLTGTYISKIVDAGDLTNWDSTSFESNLPIQKKLFIIDANKDVFASMNGTDWETLSLNYGGGSSSDGLVSTSTDSLILLEGKDIYLSSDKGYNWIKINDRFTTYSQSGKAMVIDSEDNLYIVDDSQRVFKSMDLGYTWAKINSDFNAGVNKDVRGMDVNSSDDLFIVDASGNVYSSLDSGITWTYLSDYGKGSSTDALAVDQNNYIYILYNKDIYQSVDEGLSWTKINDSFTTHSSSGKLMFFDKIDSLIIADGEGRIFKSSNEGITWTELGDVNAGSGSDPKVGAASLYNTALSLKIRNCSLADCSDAVFSNISNVNSRYFQYKVYLSTDDISVSSELYNVTIDYTILCMENWIVQYTACNVSDEKIKYYEDENSCGTLYYLPYDNGTIESCDYCTPEVINTSWSDWTDNSECYLNDTKDQIRNLTQYDSNYCGEISNQTFNKYQYVACDYCTPNWFEVNTSCENDLIIGWYNDSNDCFNLTGLDSDNNTPENNNYSCDSSVPETPSGSGSGGGRGGSRRKTVETPTIVESEVVESVSEPIYIGPISFSGVPIPGTSVRKVSLARNEKMIFYYNEQEHSLSLSEVSISQNIAEVILKSKPTKLLLELGNTRKIDLDGDKAFDIKVTLDGLEKNQRKADILIEIIEKDVGKISGKAIAVDQPIDMNSYYIIPALLLLTLLVAVIALKNTMISREMKKLTNLLHISLLLIVVVLLSASFSRTSISGFITAGTFEISSPVDLLTSKVLLTFSILIVVGILFFFLQKKYNFLDYIFGKLNKQHYELPHSNMPKAKKKELIRKTRMIQKLKEVYDI